MGTPFLLTAVVTSSQVWRWNMNCTSLSQSRTPPNPLIISEVRKRRIVPPSSPSQWMNCAVLSPQQQITHPLFKHMRINGIQMVIFSSPSSPFWPLSSALTPTMSTPNPKKIIRLLRPARETLKMRFGLCCFSLLKKKEEKKCCHKQACGR